MTFTMVLELEPFAYESPDVPFTPRTELTAGTTASRGRNAPFPDTPEMWDFRNSLFKGLENFPEARASVVAQFKEWGKRWGWDPDSRAAG
jgi:hypothetical protein